MLLSNAETDPEVMYLLKHRTIIMTPMTNAVGYYYHEREERLNKDHHSYTQNKVKRQHS